MKTTIGIRSAGALSVAAVLLGKVAAAFAGDDGGVTDGPKTPWPGSIWTPAEPSYGTAQDLQVSVTMSDSVILNSRRTVVPRGSWSIGP